MGLGGLGFVLIVVFWIAIIVAAVWLLGNLFPRNNTTRPSGDAPETAIDILKQRYARGELSKEEYETMRHDVER
jgi:putative membrane protein